MPIVSYCKGDGFSDFGSGEWRQSDNKSPVTITSSVRPARTHLYPCPQSVVMTSPPFRRRMRSNLFSFNSGLPAVCSLWYSGLLQIWRKFALHYFAVFTFKWIINNVLWMLLFPLGSWAADTSLSLFKQRAIERSVSVLRLIENDRKGSQAKQMTTRLILNWRWCDWLINSLLSVPASNQRLPASGSFQFPGWEITIRCLTVRSPR